MRGRSSGRPVSSSTIEASVTTSRTVSCAAARSRELRADDLAEALGHAPHERLRGAVVPGCGTSYVSGKR